MMLPGAGQLYVGARRRGLVLLGLTARCAAGRSLALARSAGAGRSSTGRSSPPCSPPTSRCSRSGSSPSLDALRGGGVAGLAVLAALTAAPHVAAGYVTVRGYDVLESVFADEEPARRPADRGLFFTDLPPLPR